ncbi:MAG: hypothetical protein KJP12_06110 [Acidimicrobiia bacterium]|nr:hypothetical protein [Acidimicrobiia bacterium]MBT8214781.1 hypothetical protein [Acidimicrobiia bacterium]NNF69683.1 hypothetical protein [Acidimicrobiia bacterium]NNK92430.1 hypothetical protein [Acidimicrobiia bacterium]
MRWVLGGVIVGGVVGWLVGSFPGAVVGALASGFVAAGIGPLQIKPVIVLPVIGGAVAGGLIGSSIVRILCRDAAGGCPVWQLMAGLVTAIGAAVGIAVVVTLTTRSLDEYREAAAAGREPPGPGCETGDE